MQITIIDRLALWLPALGGLVPATMTYHNAMTVLAFPVEQALLLGAVVEVIGFVAIATTLDLWEMHQDGLQARLESWDAPKSRLGGQFWVALAGTLVYLFVVVAINALLDEGGALEKTTKGLMASFGLLGGLMLALRNQMGKARAAMAEGRRRAEEEQAAERERRARIEAEEREFARRLKEQRQAERHEERMKKIDAESIRQPSATTGESPDAPGTSPASRLRWSDVSPDDYRWIVDAHPAEIVERYKITGKDPERLARTWKNYARKGLGE